VNEIAKIPEQIFQGMDSLAWDIPLASCALVHKCKVNCCDASSVEQVHLSLASSDRSLMGVSWTTLEAQPSSHILYSNNKEAETTLEVGTEGVYEQNEVEQVGYTAGSWVGSINRGMMTKLEPCTTYYYKVGSSSTNLYSKIFNFKTACPNEDFTFAVIADMGYGTNSDTTVAQLQTLVDAGKIQGIIHSGDIGYADGYQRHWDTFLNKVEPIASKIPYMVTPGNHEFWFNFQAYKHRFYMPSVGTNTASASGQGSAESEGSGDNMYYSWSYGNVHFLAMNSETAIDTQNFNNKNLDFIKKDIETLNRDVYPWLIAHHHRPLYCTSDKECTGSVGHEDHINTLTKKAEEIYHTNNVNLVLCGHVHDYERTYPVYQGKAAIPTSASTSASGESTVEVEGMPIYIVQGASGNREGNHGSFPAKDTRALWSASGSVDVGYGLLSFTSGSTSTSTSGNGSNSTMSWEFRRSSDNMLLDSMKIEK
jgi:3',5'-cyclic AMP phosphodiesterase CpdA